MNQFRSWLFVPGSNQKMLEKSKTIPADVLIFDLEDAVAPAEKESARQNVVEALKNPPTQAVYVRTNIVHSATVLDEVLELSGEVLTGFVVPKVERVEEFRYFTDYLLDQVEQKKGLAPGRLKVVPIIETAVGLSNVQDIARASERVYRLAFGSVDFALDIGVNSLAPELLDYIRSSIVIASRAAGIGAPIDTVYTDFRDAAGLAKVAAHVKKMGFTGKLAIHPSQVDNLNEVFSLTEAERAEARGIVNAYEGAVVSGLGAVQVSGRMVDLPVYDLAKRLLGE